MAPEAPADTAGPSSPPPQLPEGWLPQWEGVGRKWYYVQRTTGKSQWEIPTEPVVLTPSTTPTPMGAGPTQEPRSHPTSNSTRELESVDITAGGTYSAADSARISVGNRAHYVCSSLDSRIYGQSDNPTYGSSGVPSWYSSQTSQHLHGGYQQQLAANAAGYGQDSLQHGPVGQMNDVQQAFYASQTHPAYQMTGPQHAGQNISSSVWGNNSGTYQGHQTGYNMTQHAPSFQGFSADPAGLHNHQQPASWKITSNSQGQMARSIDGSPDSQPPWQLESQGHLNASGLGAPMNLHPSTMPKPFFGSYSSNQHAESPLEGFSGRVSNPSLVREGQHHQTSAESFPNHSAHSMVEQGRFGQSPPDPRSHSQQHPTDPALQGFSPLQHVQSQYQQQHMIRKQPGPHQATFAQGHQQYHNPVAHVNVNQYVSQHQFGPSGGSTGFSEIGHVHQAPYHQSSHYREHLEHSPGETGKTSESRFVSGPWTSAPPSAGQL